MKKVPSSEIRADRSQLLSILFVVLTIGFCITKPLDPQYRLPIIPKSLLWKSNI